MDFLLILLAKNTKKNAIVAPVRLAKTSKKSPLLVVVNLFCKTSIPIPNTTEKQTATTRSLN